MLRGVRLGELSLNLVKFAQVRLVICQIVIIHGPVQGLKVEKLYK